MNKNQINTDVYDYADAVYSDGRFPQLQEED